MSVHNENWGRCISELLKRHNLSWRGAEIRANRVVSSTYIGAWTTAPVMVPDVVLRALGRLAEDWPAVPTNEKRGLLLQLGAEITINTSGSQPLWAELRTTISTRVIRTEGDTLHRRRIRLL